ncbi:MAG: mucoidy inhibitor MuiA family protein [Anaerolineae bacterium]|nr:mucoidy inhibitor MuiA family protein [Anaerolineae bacterium]
MQVDAPIVAVTVYPDRARITRRGTVTLEKGTHDLAIQRLTNQLDAESMRANGEGTAHVRLLGVDVRQEYYTETPSVPAAELEKQIQATQESDKALQDEDELLSSQLGFLASITESAGEHLAQGIGRGRAKVTDGTALLGFVSTQYRQFSDRRREIATARRELAKEIQVLQKELDRIRGARPRQRYEAVVGLEALTPGEFTLELEYTTRGGASWQPLYDLRLLADSAEPKIELTYLGQVQQSTGEDWANVDLTLSTARPAVSAQIPKLSTWYVNIFQPPPAPQMARMDKARGMALGAGLAATADFFAAPAAEAEPEEAPPPAPAGVAQASVDTSGAAVTFHIPRKADIPADNTPHKTTVLVLDLTPELDFIAVPKLSDEVYRRATIKNDTEVTLLPGPVTLFHSGEFVGRARLNKIAPQEEFETTLGIDDRIKMERKLVLNQVGKQLIGDRRVRRYAYEIELQNLLQHETKIVVKDQLPVAANEEIKIKEEASVPEPTTRSEQNELTWELNLAALQKQKIRFEFTISAPRSNTLVGLPE